jgi:hypothetical protein
VLPSEVGLADTMILEELVLTTVFKELIEIVRTVAAFHSSRVVQFSVCIY